MTKKQAPKNTKELKHMHFIQDAMKKWPVVIVAAKLNRQKNADAPA